MNDKNLEKGKATQFRTGEEQARIAREGGKKSGEVRRMRSLLRKYIEGKVEGAVVDALKDEGRLEGSSTHLDVIIAKMVKKAEEGDSKSIDQVMELLDEKKTSIEITPTDGEDRERWMTEFFANAKAKRVTG